MAFIAHFLIAFTFTAGLYLGATYSSLHCEINDLLERQKILESLTPGSPEMSYEQRLYNEGVTNLHSRQKSIFAFVLIKLFKSVGRHFFLIF
jgi:hypothetical protein